MSNTAVAEITGQAIRVEPVAVYSRSDSDPAARMYVFKYSITITNDGDEPARLVSRHWTIIDADGHREDVDGPGVVGNTPRLMPGQSFTYQSFCPIGTLWGTMEGVYRMVRDDGSTFDAPVPRFYLHQS